MKIVAAVFQYPGRGPVGPVIGVSGGRGLGFGSANQDWTSFQSDIVFLPCPSHNLIPDLRKIKPA